MKTVAVRKNAYTAAKNVRLTASPATKDRWRSTPRSSNGAGDPERVSGTSHTVAINDRTWLDTSGHEHSNKLKMTERFRLADTNTLEHIVTYADPVFFTKPFTTRRTFQRQIGDRIMDHSCLENEKDLINLVPTLGDAGRDR